MGPIPKDSDLVSLIHAKTKIKKRDIIDMIRILPECTAEAFILSNVEPGIPVDLGAIAISWHHNDKKSPWITIKGSSKFKKRLYALKKEKKQPLSQRLAG